jgi:hypothetical protein
MKELNAAIRDIPIPSYMNDLPINERGFPIPWFVWIDRDGVADFRVIGPNKIALALRHKTCWLCGRPLGRRLAFTVGPMCVVNRVSAEPPEHLECAQYSVKACPFLSNPRMRRNEKDMPEDGQDLPGMMIRRNPGATAIYITHRFHPFRVGHGLLFRMNKPNQVWWFAEGRAATREEVMGSIDSGIPLLKTEAEKGGPEDVKELEKCIGEALQWVPK